MKRRCRFSDFWASVTSTGTVVGIIFYSRVQHFILDVNRCELPIPPACSVTQQRTVGHLNARTLQGTAHLLRRCRQRQLWHNLCQRAEISSNMLWPLSPRGLTWRVVGDVVASIKLWTILASARDQCSIA